MLPFWLAVSASLALHLGVLLSPGWPLPLDLAPVAHLDATLVAPATAKAQASASTQVAAAPPQRKRPPAKPRPIPPAEPAQNQQEAPAHATPAPVPPPDMQAQSDPPNDTAALLAAHWPRAGRIVYQVTQGASGFVIARNEQRWEHDDQHYHLRSETETTGLVGLFKPARLVLESRGRFDTLGLRPLEFVGERAGKPVERVHFLPEEGLIQLGDGSRVPFVAGAQDLLSLAHHLAALGFEPPRFALTVATGRKLVHYQGEVGPGETLETPLGLRTSRKIGLSAEAGEDALELWVDMQTSLPLKIRYRDRKGEVFDQVAIAIETEPNQ